MGSKQGKSGDKGKIVPYEESSGYRRDTNVEFQRLEDA